MCTIRTARMGSAVRGSAVCGGADWTEVIRDDWVGEILIVRWSGTKAKTSKAFGAKVGGSTRPRLLSFHAGRLHYLPSPDHRS